MERFPLLFSEKYKTILDDKGFSGEFSSGLCSALSRILDSFDEPQQVQPNRYNSYTINTSAKDQVYLEFCRLRNLRLDDILEHEVEWQNNLEYFEWFDIIELYANELSANESAAFQSEINQAFDVHHQPWRIVNGYIIKIDNQQFEQDLQRKVINLLDHLASSKPAFQNALNEYARALEFYSKREYRDCIFYAEKSYESVMKIVTGIIEGTAKELTTKFVSSDYFSNLPSRINRNGFSDNVLMALPYLRNQLNVGHGAGDDNSEIPQSLVNLVLNLSASLCIFIIDQYRVTYPMVCNKDSDDESIPF